MAVHVQSAGRIAAVDGLRGLAAIGIICLHTWYGSGSPWPTESSAGMFAMTMVAAGFVCVDFFFVISGFVLFLPTCLNQGEFGPLRPYAIRRVARIVPLDQLMAETMKVADKIAASSLPVVMMIKESINRAFETSLSEGVLFERRLFHSQFALADQKEGMAAFLEKRKPSFKNK